MKKISNLIIVTVAALALTACREEPESVAVAPSPHPAERTTLPPETVPSVVAEMAKRAEIERELRLKTESRLAEQEAAKSHWQSGALLAASGAVILLIVGTSLGSRARHDAKN